MKKSKHGNKTKRRHRRSAGSFAIVPSSASRLKSSYLKARSRSGRGGTGAYRKGHRSEKSTEPLHIAATPVPATPVQTGSRGDKPRAGQSKRNLFSVFKSGADSRNIADQEQSSAATEQVIPIRQHRMNPDGHTHVASRRHRVITETPTKRR